MVLPEWHRAHGGPLFSARLRVRPEDFLVTENLGWELSKEGEHDYLLVEKTGANTDWIAKQLAVHAKVPVRDVGYAGLKDRHAVTRQWFSVPRWHDPNWSLFAAEGVCLLEVARHLRKLRRGAHQSNNFRILLREVMPMDASALANRVEDIRRKGVPNYYGEQRFGRGAGNLRLADEWAAGRRLPRNKRSMAISTVRSLHFNNLLAARVERGTWDRFELGDKANLDGSGSVFTPDAIDEELTERCIAMDIHPSVPLPGAGSHIQPESWQDALDKARVEPGERSLRVRVRDLACEVSDNTVALSFGLSRGCFATAVLRELATWT